MVPEITYNNYYKFGFDGVYDFSFRANSEQSYQISLDHCTDRVENFFRECLKTANIIREKAKNQDIWVSYSGGIDSEFVVKTFLTANIPVKVAINVFENGYNAYDVQHARRFCQKHDLKLYEFPINVERFFEEELTYYATSTACVSPQFPVTMKLWDQLDGYIVSGNGDPILIRDPYTREFYFRIKETEDSVYRYFVWRNRDGCPGFYSYRPELLLSFLMEEEIMKMLLFGYYVRVRKVAGPKEVVYNKYASLEKREPMNGFEKIISLDNAYRSKLLHLLPKPGIFTMSIQHMIETLWPKCMTVEGGTKYMTF